MISYVDLFPPAPWSGPGEQRLNRKAALRTIMISELAQLATVNQILSAEPYPRRWVTIVVLSKAPLDAHITPENASQIDLVLTEGVQSYESADNVPLIYTSDPLSEIELIEQTLSAHPHVAEIFVRLLRTTAGLPMETAMEMESLAYSTLLGGQDFSRWLSTSNNTKATTDSISADLVVVSRDENLLHLTLNDPSRHNAYSAALRDQLVEALTLPLLDDSITDVLLTGAGRSFCSGADLGEFGMATDLASAHLIRSQQHVGRLLSGLGARVRVHAHGACIGAGIEIPAYAERLTAKPSTFFRLPELGMGLIPAAGGSVSIPRRVGRWRTLYMVLRGIDIRASRALSWGLVDEITDLP